MKCIKGCGRKASATPWLCGQCLRIVGAAWLRFNMGPHRFPPLDPEAAMKAFLNKVQKKSRAAAKRHLIEG